MKIEEAIEILEDLDTTLPQSDPDKRQEAVKLGIEALKALKQHRDLDICYACCPLPGETPEEGEAEHD